MDIHRGVEAKGGKWIDAFASGCLCFLMKLGLNRLRFDEFLGATMAVLLKRMCIYAFRLYSSDDTHQII